VAQDADAVELRQVQVEDYDVILEFSRGIPSLFAVRKHIHRVAFGFEAANEAG